LTNTFASHWYCCLNAAEKAAVDVCVGNAGPVTWFVVGVLFDACWLLAVEGDASIRRENFIANFGLTEGKLPPEDPDGITVFYLDIGIWTDISAFVLSPDGTCEDGCYIREFSS
jgi:hypothetical protein